MKSPFPGMDPYLESHWGDVHHRLVLYASDQLQSKLPRDLRARVEERVVIEPPEAKVREIIPDVRVVERPSWASGGGGGTAVAEQVEVEVEVAVAEPQLISAESREGFIQVVEAGSRDRVITVIEVLSPANKREGRDRRKYEQKQDELMAGGISLVEIDLLRGGSRRFARDESALAPELRTAYQVVVHRGYRPLYHEVYRLPLRWRLPGIRIPLRETDADVVLDLQALVAQSYINGAYDDLDYRIEPDPPLLAEDAMWADGMLKERKIR